MDEKDGDTLVHKDLDITLFGQPEIIPGKVAGALNFDGSRQYASLGSHSDSCFGNLDLCNNGVLMSLWIRPGTFKDRAVFFGTGENGFKAWYEDKNLKISADTSSRSWQVESDDLEPDIWQFLELSWHPEKGLAAYINNLKVASTENSTPRLRDSQDGQFYLGRWAGSMTGKRYPNVTFDDLQYWFGDRSFLIAHGYIQRGKCHVRRCSKCFFSGNTCSLCGWMVANGFHRLFLVFCPYV